MVTADSARWRVATYALGFGPPADRLTVTASATTAADAISAANMAMAGSGGPLRVHNFGYTTGMDDSQTQLSVRDARAHFAEVITRAQDGTPTIITRNGQAVAAVVPIEDFNALEDAIDRYFAREADRDLAENPDAPTYSMSEVVAAIFEEEPGKGAA